MAASRHSSRGGSSTRIRLPVTEIEARRRPKTAGGVLGFLGIATFKEVSGDLGGPWTGRSIHPISLIRTDLWS